MYICEIKIGVMEVKVKEIDKQTKSYFSKGCP